MISFTEFIETMRRNDVSSIALEFHPPTAYAPEKEGSDVELTVYGGSVALPGVKFCRVEFFPPQQKPEPQDPEKKPVPAAADPAPQPEPVRPVAGGTAEGNPKGVASADALPQPAAEAKPVEAAKKPEPEPEKRAEEPAKPKRESKKAKAAAETPKPQPAEPQPPLPPPAGVYDVFVETIEQDDGTKTEVKRMLISKMTLDDMLRVNASFQLGLDTDVATEALRNEITSCFI